MDSMGRSGEKEAHVVCIPCPVQSHIKAMLKLTKLLHSKGIFITFVNTEFNHRRFLKSGALQSLDRLPGFRFETIPDGLPPSDDNSTQDLDLLTQSIVNNTMLPPFKDLLIKLNTRSLPVTSILSDGFMPFTADAAKSLELPIVLNWTIGACAFMGFYQLHAVLEKGLVPLKDDDLTNGYLDTIVDDIPGMRDIRLRDLPSYVRITDTKDLIFNYLIDSTQRASKATGHVLHTFDDMEQEVVNAISSMFRNVYTIGPQQLLLNQIPSEQEGCLKDTGYSLWEEEKTCLDWLDSKADNSVVYVNFGSITIMTPEQLLEFAWGLANSNHFFLWIIRRDLIVGESATSTLGLEFMEAIKERGFILGWCPQEQVLNHASVGGFLTHGGWNSIMESLTAGVPMLCWPFIGDQMTNCRYLCTKWECGMEIDNDVKRDDVEKLVRVLIDGEEGKKMKEKAMEWKRRAEKACAPNGSSSLNLDKLIHLLTN